jgi:hypothetical protein
MTEKEHSEPNKLSKPLEQMTVADLKVELKKRGLSSTGLKKDLLERLKNALSHEHKQSSTEQSTAISSTQETSPTEDRSSTTITTLVQTITHEV